MDDQLKQVAKRNPKIDIERTRKYMRAVQVATRSRPAQAVASYSVVHPFDRQAMRQSISSSSTAPSLPKSSQ